MSYKIVSIDPGFNNLGYAYSEYLDNGTFLVRAYETLHPSDHHTTNRVYRRFFPERILTVNTISKLTHELIKRYKHDYFCCEDAYFNPARPNAYLSLITAIYGIESRLYQTYVDRSKDYPKPAQMLLYKIPASLVKKAFSIQIGAKADKSDMYDALVEHVSLGSIQFVGKKKGYCPDISEMSEHVVDAIAIGYSFTKIWYPILMAKVLDKRCTVINKATRKMLKKKKFKLDLL